MVVNSLFRDKNFILASGSPRRKQLFTMMGLNYIVDVPLTDESFSLERQPNEIAQDLAKEKGEVIRNKHNEGILVAADTIVVIDNEILGKPVDRADAYSLLTRLSGREHEVITGVYLNSLDKQQEINFTETTKVVFKNLSDEEKYGYIDTGHPMDKAGAYGIQDISAVFVKKIDGCFYNVVGFPVAAFYQQCLRLFAMKQGTK